jgi:hypothetical protein
LWLLRFLSIFRKKHNQLKMMHSKTHQIVLLFIVCILCSHCYICDVGFVFTANVIFVDKVTGENLFFGANAQFSPDSLEMTWGECTTREQDGGHMWADTASFEIYMGKKSCGIIRYPDGSSDTLRMYAYKRKCDFNVELYFNDELLGDYYGTRDAPITLIKN